MFLWGFRFYITRVFKMSNGQQQSTSGQNNGPLANGGSGVQSLNGPAAPPIADLLVQLEDYTPTIPVRKNALY